MTKIKEYQELKQLINLYAEKEAEIKNNSDLSESGKAKRLGELRNSRLHQVHDRINDLRREAVLTAIKHERLAGAGEAAGELDNEKLDWSRLHYEAEVVRGEIAKRKGVFELTEAFENVKKKGDKYQLKAWKDILPANVPADLYSEKDWALLLDEVEYANASKLTEEQVKFKAEQAELLDDLRAIQSTAIEASKAVGKDERLVLQRVFDGIKASDDGRLELSFSVWSDDKPEKIYEAIDGKYQADLERQLEVNASFGMNEYMPNFDGMA